MSAVAPASQTLVVGYRSRPQLAAALRGLPVTALRTLPQLRAAEVRVDACIAGVAATIASRRGIEYAEPAATRHESLKPALAAPLAANYEWGFAATHEDAVPEWVLRAASRITIAVVDTGADVKAPDLAAKQPRTHDVFGGGTKVVDANGHGTFVASLAAGSVTNGDGIAGFGGDARLLVIRAGRRDGTVRDPDEAAGIVYAVNHGARIVNLSLGGPQTSKVEQRAIDYAYAHGVLVVAAAGNNHELGSPTEYPAALVQPSGSNGVGGKGLSVGASLPDGTAASFSNSGSYVSLAAPGVDVVGAVASTSSRLMYPREALPGSHTGLYGVESGTSFAAAEVSGAAALVWAANPWLTATTVARILKETASGGGVWSPQLGYGVIDVAAAVNEAAASRPSS